MSKAKKSTAGTIGAFATGLVKDASLTAEAIIAKVRAKFPKSKFSATHVYWYRGHAGVKTELKHDGVAAKKSAKKDGAKKPAKKAGAKKPAKKAPVKAAPANAADGPTKDTAL